MMDFITEPIRDLGFGGFFLGAAFLALLVIGIFKGGGGKDGGGSSSSGGSSSKSSSKSSGGSTTPPPSTPTAG